jgi:putative ABC transport system permease protein
MKEFVALAFKNVFRNGKRSLTLGINYAVVAFILVALAAFTRGAQTNVSRSIVQATAAHITVSGQYAKDGRIYNGLLRTDDIMDSARKSLGGDAVTLKRYLLKSAVYFNGISKRLSFTGVDAAVDTGFRGQMSFVSGSWDAWAADPNGVAIPESVAKYFDLKTGDDVVVSVRTRFGAFNTGILKVEGIYRTDNYFLGELTLTHFDFLRALDLADEGAATTVYVYLKSTARLADKRDAFASALAREGFEVSKPETDSEAIAAVSAASQRYEVDKIGRDRVMAKLSTIDEVLGIVRNITLAVQSLGAFLAAVMLFVIAVSVFINLRMTINERLREIGAMRAMGVDAAAVTALFTLEGSALALMSAAAGAVLSALVCVAFRAGVSFPAGGNLAIFLDAGHLALEPNLGDTAIIVAAIALIAAAFSFFPARRGGRIKPVEALTATF